MLSHEVIRETLAPLAVDPAAAELIAPVMARYVDELHRNNDRFGLIGRDDAADPYRILSRHILDSIAPWRIVVQLMENFGRRTIYDLGSGAGMPGIPLGYTVAAHRPEALDDVVLVERRSKRVAFLLGVLPGLRRTWTGSHPLAMRVVETDTGDLSFHETRPASLNSAVVVFRAYQQTGDALLSELSRVFAPGTPVCALKGRSEQVHRERTVLENSPYAEHSAIHVLSSPSSDTERSALTWRIAGDEGRSV
ncbi:MAG: RsmG family class I SAM-dependent methyltransferase [Alkalispirochaeta sp.]